MQQSRMSSVCMACIYCNQYEKQYAVYVSQFLMKKKITTTSLSRLCRNTNREIPAGHANVIGAKLCAL